MCSNKQTKPSLFRFSLEDSSVGHGPGEEAYAWLLWEKHLSTTMRGREVDEFWWISAVLPATTHKSRQHCGGFMRSVDIQQLPNWLR